MAKKTFTLTCDNAQINAQASAARFSTEVKKKTTAEAAANLPAEPRTTVQIGIAPKDGSAMDFKPGKAYKVTIEEA